jgi:hypothetical protein
MRRVWKRWWFWPAVLIVLAVNTLLILCAHFRVWTPTEYRVYQAMKHECHPAWRDYHFGRVRAGDPVDDVIARTQPIKVEQKGRWTTLSYSDRGFTGMAGVAYDGRMVLALAMSCTWTRLFFDDLTEAQSWEICGTSRDDPRRWGIAPVVR